MTTINISKDSVNVSNQATTPSSNFHILHDIGLFLFSMAFVAIASHVLNESAVLTFTEQLAFINKPKFSGVLIVLFGVLFAFKNLYDCISISIIGDKMSKKFSSVWVPIKFAVLTTFFIPFEQNGVITSSIVETIKWIIQLVAN